MRFERLYLPVAAVLTLAMAPVVAAAQAELRDQRIRIEDVPGIRSLASRDFRFEMQERQDRLRDRQLDRDWDLRERHQSREIERALQLQERLRDQLERAQSARERSWEKQERSRQLQERARERAIERAMQAREAAERRREEARIRTAMRVRWQ